MKKMLKAAAILCVLCLISVFAVSCSNTNNGTLVMGTNAAFPPFEFKDNTGAGTNGVDGVDAAMMKAIAEELHMKLEIKDMEFDSLSNALENGQIDCIAAGFTVDPDREESMDFSKGYYEASQAVLVKKGTTIKSADELKGKIIGGQNGTTGLIDKADKLTSKDKIKGFSNGAVAVEALKNGQVDAVIIDVNPAKEYVKNNANTIDIVENLFDKEEYAIAVKKGDKELLEKIDKALQKIKDSGKMDEIIAQYIK